MPPFFFKILTPIPLKITMGNKMCVWLELTSNNWLIVARNINNTIVRPNKAFHYLSEIYKGYSTINLANNNLNALEYLTYYT